MVIFLLFNCWKSVKIFFDVLLFKVLVGLFVIIKFGWLIIVCVMVICCCCLFESCFGCFLFLFGKLIFVRILWIWFLVFFGVNLLYKRGNLMFFLIVSVLIKLKFWKIKLIVLFLIWDSFLLEKLLILWFLNKYVFLNFLLIKFSKLIKVDFLELEGFIIVKNFLVFIWRLILFNICSVFFLE